MCFDQLDIPSQANVRMDRKVGAFISQMTVTPNTYHAPILPSQSICITHKKHIVTSSIQEHLIGSFNLDQRQQYLTKHVDIPAYINDNIEWNGINRYLKRNKTTKGKIVKTMNSAWHTMTVANKWNPHDSPLCPLCTQTNKTCDHVLHCQNHHMCRVRDKYLRNLQQQLSQLNTDPNISKCITSEITT